MYIVPNTTLRVLKGVPLDPTYEHTIYFYTETAQQDYFTSKMKYQFPKLTYQRVNKGVIRIQRCAEDLYDCNYLMFQNASFGNKFFYAFITGIEYVNNIVSDISYEIDVIQTYHFDYKLGQCFVEREHSESDRVGENLIPENLECGEYVVEGFSRTGYLEHRALIVASTFNKQYADFGGMVYGGIYAGLAYNIFAEGQELDAQSFIEGAGNKSSGFVSMFYYPSDMLPANMSDVANVQYKQVTKSKIQSGGIFNGYTPVNNKLYTYPYNFLYVTNNQGNSADYRYEFFSTSDCNFRLSGEFTPTPTMLLRPLGYKANYPLDGNFDEGLTVSGWGQIPFSTDSYKAWLAQQASSIFTRTLSSSMAGAMTAGWQGALVAGAVQVGSGLAEIGAKTILQGNSNLGMPKQAHGNYTTSAMLSMKMVDFFFFPKHITREFAIIIDNYFTKYGYACHRVKVPNRNSRPQFNYVKTINCIVEALDTAGHGLPADDEAKISKIYDRGITFWKNPANIGDYTVSNAPANP